MHIDADTFPWNQEHEIYTVKELADRVAYARKASITWLDIWFKDIYVYSYSSSGEIRLKAYGTYVTI